MSESAPSATRTPSYERPAGWHAQADACWQAGDRHAALSALLTGLNAHGRAKPTAWVLQLVYYMFQLGDWASAAGVLTAQYTADASRPEILSNLVACLSRAGRHAEAVARAHEYRTRFGDDPVVLDALAANLAHGGDFAQASHFGTQALMLKHGRSLSRQAALSRPAAAAQPHDPVPSAAQPSGHGGPGLLPTAGGESSGSAPHRHACVIAFSLWGQSRRYLWGALDNLLAARLFYPEWRVRIYHDDSVPSAWQQRLRDAGAELCRENKGEPLRSKLAWRFQVANDPNVDRFLVRDIDSVLSERERQAVDEWVASGRTFHVMRDWWTHTDLILAGMWGGMAGRLPDMRHAVQHYPSPAMETPNIDQWFLRDEVWPLIHHDCWVQDRCFRMPGSKPWPSEDPPSPVHVGQNVHATQAAAQQRRLAPWLVGLDAGPEGQTAA